MNMAVERGLCKACAKIDEQEFQMVVDFIKSHPQHTIMQIEEETGISNKKIAKWLKEDRVLLVRNNTCARCHTVITTGKYCAKCASVLFEGLNKVKSALSDAPKGTGYYSRG